MKRLRSIDAFCFENNSAPNINSRKIKPETKIRSQFISKGYRKFPKKEYIRCKLIRGHKRTLREIMMNEEYVKNLANTTKPESPKQLYWNLLVNSFVKYRAILSELIPVEVGPVNELMKRRGLKVDHLKKSFNGDFCRDYLSTMETRESYFYYIEFLFSELNCSKLIKKFGFRCCLLENHEKSCCMKWLLLKRFCGQMILEELEITPFTPENYFYPIPSIPSNL